MRRIFNLDLPGWRWATLAFALVVAGAVATPILAQDATITRWTLPGSSPANSLALDPSGMVWATTNRDGTGRGSMFRLDAANDQITTYSHDFALGDSLGAVVDTQSKVWFTSNTVGGYRINRLDPASGEITGWPVTEAGYAVALDSLGNVWFTCKVGAAPGQPALCKLAPDTNTLTNWPLASVPTSIFIDSQDKIWHVRPDAMKVGVLDPLANSLTQWSASGTGMSDRPRTIFVTGGEAWFTIWQSGGGSVVRLTPATNQMTQWPCPPGACFAPSGLLVDSAGKVWFTERQYSSPYIDRLDPTASPPVFTRWSTGAPYYCATAQILSGAAGAMWIHYVDCWPSTPIDRFVP